MPVSSNARSDTYGWLGQFPQLREWVGPRHVHDLKAHRFTTLNTIIEISVPVSRNDIHDDNPGIFSPVFGLLASGLKAECYDRQAFVDTDHPVDAADDTTDLVSNMQEGTDEPWDLSNTSRMIKLMVWR